MSRPLFLSAAVFKSAAVAAIAFSASMPASAQGAVSQSDQDACTPDVFRLCQDYIPDETAIVACLQAKRQQLSAACHQVFAPAPAPGEPTHRAHHHHAKRHRTIAR